MSSLNKVTLIGRLGKDPEIRSMQNGNRIANFSIATSESWKEKNTGERKEKSEWHNIVVFSEGLVKVVENYVKKGSKIYVEGALQTRKWQDKSGADRYSTEVVLQGFGAKLILLDGKSDNNAQQQHSVDKGNAYQPDTYGDLDDEIPF